MLKSMINPDLSGKKTKLVLGMLLIMLLAMSTGLMAGTYSGGDGSSGNPYQIANLTDLGELSSTSADWVADFIQTADIDATATSGWDSGAGFSPIGSPYSAKFSGCYDGDNHTISNLKINRGATSWQALFGNVGGSNPIVIKDLGLIDVSIIGNRQSAALMGQGTYGDDILISNCYSTGSITAQHYSGGLIGISYNTVTNCYSSCSVTQIGGDRAGGLIGQNNTGTVSQCYATGNVSAISRAGGCIGNDTGTVNNCYSTGSVTVSDDIGLVGGFVGIKGNGSTITNCYSTGAVSCTGTGDYVGGFSGYNPGSLSYCFWDMTTSGQTTDEDNAIGRTTAQMKDYTTFTDAGWDFKGLGAEGIWNIGNGRNDGYPYLDWQYSDDPPLPVTLSTFYALYSSGTPTIYWATECEEENQGWNIYRGEDADALINNETITINPALIPGAGTTQQITNYQFEDEHTVDAGNTYWYWLESVDFSGVTEIHPATYLTIPSGDPPPVPILYGLHQNYPNPFNPSTIITFSLTAEDAENAEVIIYNPKGQIIKVFNDLIINSDEKGSIIWDGKDQNGNAVSSGIYLYKMRSDGRYTSTKKMILMKQALPLHRTSPDEINFVVTKNGEKNVKIYD